MAVHDGTVDRAIVPIENSLEGPIGVTLDTLAEEHDVTIVGELVLAVSPCLIAREPLELVGDRAGRLASPAARPVRALPARQPARRRGHVRRVHRRGGPRRRRRAGAVGGARHARGRPSSTARRCLPTASRTSPATRRASSGSRARRPSPTRRGPPKTSLAFWGSDDDSPGWLVRCLSEFAFRGVNLTKIESRPLRAQLGHYRFFVDCEGDARRRGGRRGRRRAARALRARPRARFVPSR